MENKNDSGYTSTSDSTTHSTIGSTTHPTTGSTARTNLTEVDEYPMVSGHRGNFLIISNANFKSDTVPTRHTAEMDAVLLESVMDSLGFVVTVHRNQTIDEMHALMCDAGDDDHSRRDCFGVAVLTHGDDQGIWGTDGQIQMENFISAIKDCTTLSEKPKIFILQASRGKKVEVGQRICADGGPSRASRKAKIDLHLPKEADFVYAYSTPPGYASVDDDQDGSFFIKTLCDVLSNVDLREKLDFVRLLTRVNRLVATEFKIESPDFNKALKQVPSIVSMLTKDLYFRPAQNSTKCVNPKPS